MLQVKAVAHIMRKWPFDNSTFKCWILPNNGLRLGWKQSEPFADAVCVCSGRVNGYSRSVSRNGRGWRYGAERVVDSTTSASQVGAPVSHRRPCGGIGEACHWKKRREERRWHKLLLLRGAPVTTNWLSVGSVTTHCHPKMWCFKTTLMDVKRCVMLAKHIKHGSMIQPVILNWFCFRTQICGNLMQLKLCLSYKGKTKMSFKIKWWYFLKVHYWILRFLTTSVVEL